MTCCSCLACKFVLMPTSGQQAGLPWRVPLLLPVESMASATIVSDAAATIATINVGSGPSPAASLGLCRITDCPGHVPAHQEAGPTMQHAVACSTHGLHPVCVYVHSCQTHVLCSHACSIVPLDFTSKAQVQRQNYEFHGGDSRSLNQVQGPPARVTLCDCTCHMSSSWP